MIFSETLQRIFMKSEKKIRITYQAMDQGEIQELGFKQKIKNK